VAGKSDIAIKQAILAGRHANIEFAAVKHN